MHKDNIVVTLSSHRARSNTYASADSSDSINSPISTTVAGRWTRYRLWNFWVFVTRGRNQRVLLTRVSHFAQVMALLPARDPRAIAAKPQTAAWSANRGKYRLGLSAALSADLPASPNKDSAKAP